jgi:hypothetical protein
MHSGHWPGVKRCSRVPLACIDASHDRGSCRTIGRNDTTGGLQRGIIVDLQRPRGLHLPEGLNRVVRVAAVELALLEELVMHCSLMHSTPL